MAGLMDVDLIVLAAGRGLRAGARVPKQFAGTGASLGQDAVTILTATVARAAAARLGGRTVVTVPGDRIEEGRAAVAAGGLPDAEVIAGGPGRLASLHLAAEHLSSRRAPGQAVIVHDGTRPFTPPDLFTAVVKALADHDAAWPAAAVANAVLTPGGAGGWVPATSSDLLACATPIATSLDSVLRAMRARTSDEGALIAGLVAMGLDWVTVPDSPLNFKVTTERDLGDALCLLDSWGRLDPWRDRR